MAYYSAAPCAVGLGGGKKLRVSCVPIITGYMNDEFGAWDPADQTLFAGRTCYKKPGWAAEQIERSLLGATMAVVLTSQPAAHPSFSAIPRDRASAISSSRRA